MTIRSRVLPDARHHAVKQVDGGGQTKDRPVVQIDKVEVDLLVLTDVELLDQIAEPLSAS